MKSTIFKNFNEVIEQKDILKVLDDIKTGTYRNAITYLRKSLAEDKKEAAERAKKIPSGIHTLSNLQRRQENGIPH